jgi:hypothetical protein
MKGRNRRYSGRRGMVERRGIKHRRPGIRPGAGWRWFRSSRLGRKGQQAEPTAMFIATWPVISIYRAASATPTVTQARRRTTVWIARHHVDKAVRLLLTAVVTRPDRIRAPLSSRVTGVALATTRWLAPVPFALVPAFSWSATQRGQQTSLRLRYWPVTGGDCERQAFRENSFYGTPLSRPVHRALLVL